jgi:pimeloyl-ACP methyl ester carboxylesterase
VTRGDLDLGGWRIRYVRAGVGPPVLLLHGLAASVYTWKDALPALAASHEVIAFDFPGFGDSSIPRPLDAASYPGVTLAVMDRLGIARASLVGNSIGGAVAATLAADHPERVDRLVLIDAVAFNLADADRPWLLRLMGSRVLAGLIERLPLKRCVVALGLRQVFHDGTLVTRERIDAYARPMMRPGAMVASAELLRSALPGGIVERLGRVRAPTLVVWGREDRWIPVRDARRFADAIPGARVVVLDGCGHVPQEERPEETAAAILEFIRSGTD